ncbi:MAG: hypothetical protein AAB631_03210 [Patescibacteria group bacterium]
MESILRFIPVLLGLIGAWMIIVAFVEFFVARFPVLVGKKVFPWFFFSFVLFSVLDIHSTSRLISVFGFECEGSLIPYYLFKTLGMAGMVFTRLVVLNTLIYFLFKRSPEALLGINMIYPFVIVWNYYQVVSHGIDFF